MSTPVDETREAAVRSNRRQLLVIALIAVVSLGGATLFYKFADRGAFSTVIRDFLGTTNNGEFVNPVKNVAELHLLDHSNTPYVHGNTWWIWLVQPGECAADCQDTLTKMRNLHVLLNKDAERLRRALIDANRVADGAGMYEIPALRGMFPKLHQLRQTNDEPVRPGIYIVDTRGNLVFWYASDAMGKPVLEDLKRLLKVSQIG